MAIPRERVTRESMLEDDENLAGVDQVVLPCGVRVRGVRADEDAIGMSAANMCQSADPTLAAKRALPVPVPPAARPTGGASAKPLSEREREVLSLLVEGASDKEVARALGLSRSTVESHVGSLYVKTGAMNRVQLGVIAIDCGLVGFSTGTNGAVPWRRSSSMS